MLTLGCLWGEAAGSVLCSGWGLTGSCKWSTRNTAKIQLAHLPCWGWGIRKTDLWPDWSQKANSTSQLLQPLTLHMLLLRRREMLAVPLWRCRQALLRLPTGGRESDAAQAGFQEPC